MLKRPRVRLTALAAGFVALRWAALVAVGLLLGADWPAGRDRWQDFLVVCTVVTSMDLTAFLMLARAGRTTALGLAIVGFYTAVMAWFFLALAGALWPEELPFGRHAVTTLSLWLVGTSLAVIGLLLATADPAEVPPGRTVLRRVLLWSLAMAVVAGSVLAAGRWW